MKLRISYELSDETYTSLRIKGVNIKNKVIESEIETENISFLKEETYLSYLSKILVANNENGIKDFLLETQRLRINPVLEGTQINYKSKFKANSINVEEVLKDFLDIGILTLCQEKDLEEAQNAAIELSKKQREKQEKASNNYYTLTALYLGFKYLCLPSLIIAYMSGSVIPMIIYILSGVLDYYITSKCDKFDYDDFYLVLALMIWIVLSMIIFLFTLGIYSLL